MTKENGLFLSKDEVTRMEIGLFIDELNKLWIIYVSKKATNKKEYTSQPHPKVKQTN